MSNDEVDKAAVSQGQLLRARILSTHPSVLGFQADSDFPRVWGVVVDYSVGEAMVSVVALRDGTASLYTNAQFGIIGAQHPPVREAAVECVQKASEVRAAAPQFFEKAHQFPYPADAEIAFYLLNYCDVERAAAPEAQVLDQTHPLMPIFAYAQGVITQLRLMSLEEDAGGEPN